jgi:hypothetical protein
MSTLPPEFKNWLDYALATMDVPVPTQVGALEEVDRLRRKVAMPWVSILENWQKPLAEKLGRSAEDIVENSLQETDFSDESVRIQFADGSDLKFERAFYLGETPSDGSIHRAAVFTEHCGFHEFWIGPGSRISATSTSTSTECEFPEDNWAWESMAPVGREWGSPDFDRLMDEDAKKFATDLAQWIRHSHQACGATILDQELSADVLNIQNALNQLGQEVTLEVAAAVWKNYSNSLSASWMSGAETVESAKRTLFLNCPRGGEKSRS